MEIDILDKFSTNLKEVLTRALEETIILDQKNVDPITLLNSMSKQKGSIAYEILSKNNFSSLGKKKNISSETSGTTATKTKNLTPVLSIQSKRAIEKAVLAANLFSHNYVGTEHLLFGLLEIKNKTIYEEFQKQNIDVRKLKSQVESILKTSSKFSEMSERDDAGGIGSAAMGPMEPGLLESDISIGSDVKYTKKSKTPALDFFSIDLTSPDVQAKIDPLIGRENEVARMMQILCRRHKNNPLLLGEPGVGKTAVVEGLAKKIITGEVPEELIDKKILSLDLSLIIAGTMYRGEFEARLKQVIEEIRNDKNLIIFIDEVHNIIGAGSTAGSLDAANILKPALARGELHCIGATTLEEYKKHIESDPALERRFQAIQIKEPGRNETVEILQGIKPNYERFHNIEISKQAIETAVDVSIRYLTDKFLPDKAIDLVDEAASGMKINLPANPKRGNLRDIEYELSEIQELKHRAVFDERYTEAVELKAREKKLEKKLGEQKKEFEKSKSCGILKSRHILEVLSRQIGVPIEDLEMSKNNFLELKNRLKSRIIGQDHVLEEVVKTISRSKTGFSDPNRPLASFLFIGPSGVGKTELARTLARELYPQEDALVQIDMSEFKESYSASKLLGSPAGYVGYKERNKFTDEVRKKPYAVVLFDEFEKAHPDIQNLLLQILDQGTITDSTGRKINFKNTVILLTSNLGQDALAKKIGFGNESIFADKEILKEFEAKLKEHFRPELLNRLDRVLYFNPISKIALGKIIDNSLDIIIDKAKAGGLTLTLEQSALNALIKKCINPEQGARAVKKTLLNWVENPLSEMLLNGKIKKGNNINLSYNKGKFVISKK